MATTTLHSPLTSLDSAPHAARAKAKAPRASLLQRMYAAIVESRTRQSEREIARYLASTGGRLTDDVERTIERRFLNH